MKKTVVTLITFIVLAGMTVMAGENPTNPPKTFTLSGKVVDKTTNEALAGALIIVEGTDLKAYTDLDGNFTLKDLPQGSLDIKCSLISYKDSEEKIFGDELKKEQILELESSSTW